MKDLFVKAKKGVIIRNPATQQPIPEDGLRVPNNSFWRRRIKAGDVETEKPAKTEKPKSSFTSKVGEKDSK